MKTVVLTTMLLAILFLGIPISCQTDDVDGWSISGRIIDKDTKEGIPDIRFKVDGVTQFGFGRRVELANTSTKSDGTFKVSFGSVENAAFYDFFANWGSVDHYTEGTEYHGDFYLDSITKNGIPMVFELSKMEQLRIHLKNSDPNDASDYVGLHFYSDDMGFQRVRCVKNFGVENLIYSPPAFNDGTRTEWVGANVNSVIDGHILVNEQLTIIATVRKDGRLTEIIKVVNGERNKIAEIAIDY